MREAKLAVTFRQYLLRGLAACVLVLLLLAGAGTAFAQNGAPASPTGVIQGVLKMGTSGVTADLSALPVSLQPYSGTVAIDAPLTVQTGAGGTFSFQGVDRRSFLHYQVRTRYQGVDYASPLVTFGAGQSVIPVELSVFAATDRVPAIHILQLHWIVTFAPGGINVAEFYILSNPADRTYLGQQAQGVNGRAVVTFPLPKNAQNLAIVGDSGTGRFQRVGHSLVDTKPLPPGEQARRIMFRYHVPYASFHTTILHELPYPAAQVELIVPETGEKVRSTVFQRIGQREISGQTYEIWQVENVSAGRMLSAQFSHIPGQPLIPVQSVALISVLLFFLLIIAGVWFGTRRPARQTVDGAARREELLTAIARLDDQYEAGELATERYQQKRTAYKRALARIWPGLGGTSRD